MTELSSPSVTWPPPADDPRWAKLREPFPPSQIGKLPRVWCPQCREAQRGNACQQHKIETCRVCRNRLTTGHLHLDYVGHAAVTSRLLQVDPTWNWRPATKEELELLPGITVGKEMWIVLTVLGVDRFGVGDDMNRGGTDGKKIMLGDAIRNAAQRFGVAIDLWSKEDLIQKDEAAAQSEDEVRRGLADESGGESEPSEDWVELTKAAKDLEELDKLARRCNAVGEFHGKARAAMATKKRQFEQAAKRAAEKGAAQ